MKFAIITLTQVHIQIAISRYSNIYYSHESIGTAWVRFERSRLLDHKGTRTVVIRIIKIITPVKCVISLYDDYICLPRAGELHQRFSGKDQSVWSVNIDKSKSTMLPGLRLLWDA